MTRLPPSVCRLVAFLYPERAAEVQVALSELANRYVEVLSGRLVPPPSERTAMLITYGDSIRRAGEAPLVTLADVLARHVGDSLSDVHLLPLFPWTSDDGFGVVDHRRVDPALGGWPDVARLGKRYDLMLDFVANHVSSSSDWFTGWLAGDPARAGFFVEPGQVPDTSAVVRPRTSPLFHEWRRPDGRSVSAWTTFGPDQVDVNVANPAVLLELTDILLGHVARGASAIRLDAIGFLWKESGTPCMHHSRTHAVVKLWRAILDVVAPGTRLVTETNVPHAENVTYFGDGHDEATMVYQFALPPLVLHSFVSGSTRELAAWASSIEPVSETASWLNFLASHDGIGLRPVEGILSPSQLDALTRRVTDLGGRASLASRPDGTPFVYELNVSYLDALCDSAELADDAIVSAKALAAHTILFALVGVPAIYVHSLFGSSSWREGVAASGMNRRINRQHMDADALEDELVRRPRRRLVLSGLRHLLRVRAGQPGLSPFAAQRIEPLSDAVLAVRRAAGTPAELLCLTNVTPVEVDLPTLAGVDVLAGVHCDGVRLPPFGCCWLRTRTT